MILTFSLKRSGLQSNKQTAWHAAAIEAGGQVMSVNCGSDEAGRRYAGDFPAHFVSPLPSLSSFLLQLCLVLMGWLPCSVYWSTQLCQIEWKRGLPALSLQPAGDNAFLLPRI